MATITRLLGIRHFRSDPSAHVLQFRRGALVRSARGPTFWFLPLSTSCAEVPCDDRDETFLFHARSADFQDVTAQGVITYRVADPETLASRVDFSVDLRTGLHLGTPLDQLSQLLIQAAQQHAWEYLAGTPVRQILAEGAQRVRDQITRGLVNEPTLAAMGIEIASVRVSSVAPTAELEKALQAPTHEAIQEQADEAMFQRRALAVEKERAIQENELQNLIELARREEELIAHEGANARERATNASGAKRIAATAKAGRRRTAAAGQADAIRRVEAARVSSERERMAIYQALPPHVMAGLAARELASKLQRIDHLPLSPETLGPTLQRLVAAGTRRLEADANGGGENGRRMRRAWPRVTDRPCKAANAAASRRASRW